MKVRKLLHTRYRVNDLAATVRFYKKSSASKKLAVTNPLAVRNWFSQSAGSEELIELCYFPSSGPVQVQPDLTHLAFEVDSLEDFGKHLAKFGLKYPTVRSSKRTAAGSRY